MNETNPFRFVACSQWKRHLELHIEASEGQLHHYKLLRIRHSTMNEIRTHNPWFSGSNVTHYTNSSEPSRTTLQSVTWRYVVTRPLKQPTFFHAINNMQTTDKVKGTIISIYWSTTASLLWSSKVQCRACSHALDSKCSAHAGIDNIERYWLTTNRSPSFFGKPSFTGRQTYTIFSSSTQLQAKIAKTDCYWLFNSDQLINIDRSETCLADLICSLINRYCLANWFRDMLYMLRSQSRGHEFLRRMDGFTFLCIVNCWATDCVSHALKPISVPCAKALQRPHQTNYSNHLLSNNFLLLNSLPSSSPNHPILPSAPDSF